MNIVHLFIATGRFRSIRELRAFIDETYTEDGDGIPSPFIREVGLTGYEPMCIEAIQKDSPIALPQLLADVSHGEQWIPKVDATFVADSAICVFAPNLVSHPNRSSMKYVGAFNRSPTAEQVFSSLPGIETDSAGLGNGAITPLSPEQLDWADLIFVMEKTHRNKLARKFKAHLGGKRVICLDIPDEYEYMDPVLVKLLTARVSPYLK